MIIFGFFSAIASGVALPGHMLLFGQVINNFVYYGNVITNNTDIGGTLHDAALSYSTSVNMTCSPDLFINGSLFSVPGEMLLCHPEYSTRYPSICLRSTGSASNSNKSLFSVLCGTGHWCAHYCFAVLEY